MLPAKASHTANPFIVSTSLEKPDAASRRLIRSHVMRGKNRRRPTVSLQKPRPTPGKTTEPTSGRTDMTNHPCWSLGTYLAATRFADDMDPNKLDLVHKFFTIVKEGLYPMESHMALDVNNSVWFQYLLSDAMHLYSLLWSTQEHFDWLQGFPPSNTSMRYKAKALCLLQKRLGEDSLAISNTTIVAVVTLLFFTALKGDHECATKHMAGLHKIVTLRGGLYSLKDNKQVHLSVCRADLSVALVNGTLPLFSSEGQSWGRDSALPSPPRPPIPSCPVARIVDPRLSDIESELRTICASANRTFHTKEKLTPGAFQDQLIRIEYCLMALMFSPADFNETLRLGLLAFATAIFLQPQGVKVWFERLSRKLRDSIFTADWAMIEILGYRLWLLFVAGLSDPTVDDGHWLHPLLFSALQDAQLTTWESVRSRLKSFPWIDTLHDAGGKRLYDLTTIVMTQSRKATATDYHALAI